jgi:hypothetical protein
MLLPKNDYDYAIGIDVGKHTGIALWNCKKQQFTYLKTMLIHQAIFAVLDFFRKCERNNEKLIVRVEDARLRKWFGNSSVEKLQGAGSVKRDSTIWEDFLSDNHIPYYMVAPKDHATKMSAESFKQLTHISKRVSEHVRDAATLVFGI